MKTVNVGMYADQTGLYSESELSFNNWTEMEIPEWIVRKWYVENDLADETAHELNIPLSEATFEKWLNEVSWGDDTDGLYDFSIENGYTPKIWYDGKAIVLYRDYAKNKHIVFNGTYNECREFGREHGWELDGNELEIEDER